MSTNRCFVVIVVVAARAVVRSVFFFWSLVVAHVYWQWQVEGNELCKINFRFLRVLPPLTTTASIVGLT